MNNNNEENKIDNNLGESLNTNVEETKKVEEPLVITDTENTETVNTTEVNSTVEQVVVEPITIDSNVEGVVPVTSDVVAEVAPVTNDVAAEVAPVNNPVEENNSQQVTETPTPVVDVPNNESVTTVPDGANAAVESNGNNSEPPKGNKKWIFIIIGILLIAVIAAAIFVFVSPKDNKEENKKDNETKEEEKKESTATPLLYEVTKEGSDTKIYLFGSIHVADDRAYPLPDAVLDAYEESDYLAVELDLIEYEQDEDAQMKMLEDMLVEEGKTVKDYLREDTYNKLVDYLKENYLYNELLEYYRPVFFDSIVSNLLVEMSDLDTEKGIDRYFLEDAKDNDKEILEVESVEFQNTLLVSFPDELYDFTISYSIDNEEESIEDTKKLYDLWVKGDEEGLVELLHEETEYDKEKYDYENLDQMLEDYDKKLVFDRNIGMADKAEEYFKDGKDVFYVVGTAHIIGDDALVDLLTERGYTVTKVEYKNVG